MDRKEFQNTINENGAAILHSTDFINSILLEYDALEYDEKIQMFFYIPVPDTTEKIFNLELEESMEFINLYAVYCPENDTLQFHGNIYSYDGEPDFPFVVQLTDEQQTLFRTAVENNCKDIYNKSISLLWEEQVANDILEKCQSEYKEYKQNLLCKDVTTVYNSSFETSYKEEIVALLERGGIFKMLNTKQLAILNNEENPLHFMYEIYSSWDDNADLNEHIETVIWTLFPNVE